MDENKTLDPKLEALRGVFDTLSDEQKEQATACKTLEEQAAFARKAGIELPDEALEATAGGQTIIGFESSGKKQRKFGKLVCTIIDKPEYPCPKCRSWNVENYNPGFLWKMRVLCLQCGYEGVR